MANLPDTRIISNKEFQKRDKRLVVHSFYATGGKISVYKNFMYPYDPDSFGMTGETLCHHVVDRIRVYDETWCEYQHFVMLPNMVELGGRFVCYDCLVEGLQGKTKVTT